MHRPPARPRTLSSTLVTVVTLWSGCLLLSNCLNRIAAAEADGQGEAGAEIIRATTPTNTAKKPGDLSVSEFAKSGMVGSAVGITTDPSGRVFVSNTTRRNNAAVDIRKNPFLLMETLASTSIADKRAMIHRRMTEWKKLESYTEQIICVIDTDGDGKADKSFNAFDGFGTDINGVAAGVLWYDNALYVTSIPSLYKLTDPDGDGIFDKQEELATGLGIHVGYGGHDMHGPTLGMDGRIYWSMGDKGYHVEKDGKDWFGPGLGAVFRVEPDGSNFEVFCNGLRNPQELAFDAYGNLFTADHDGDFGDKEGLRFLIDGSDSGWRAHYQYRNVKKWGASNDYNPWMIDDLWVPPKPEHPAYLTPVFQQLPGGPIGFEWEPGTALNDRYRGYFFLADSTKKITAFQLVPQGAGFAWKNDHVVLAGPFSTGLFFGADGGLYAADWGDNAWAAHMNGRVLKLDDPTAIKAPARLSTQALLQANLRKKPNAEIAALLAHADQRVRLQAQFALVAAGDAGRGVLLNSAQSGPQLARIHALWGLGTLARRRDSAAAALLPPFLNDADAEIRAQAAKMMGEAPMTGTADALIKLLSDPEPRPRLMAGIALGRLGQAQFQLSGTANVNLGQPSYFAAVVKFLADNDNRDVYLRHAGVMALVGCSTADRSSLLALNSHSSRSVRLAAIVALRRLREPKIVIFLQDADQTVAREAALAIHDDLSIPEALPALAALLEKEGLADEPLLRRAISANLRLGDANAATRLATFSSKRTIAGEIRSEAIDSLMAFLEPQALDRVQGVHRGLPARDRAMVIAAATPVLEGLIFGKSKSVQAASARLIAALGLPEWRDRLATLAADTTREPAIRVTALTALEAMQAPSLSKIITAALIDEQPTVRAFALGILMRTQPNDAATYTAINAALASKTLSDRQQAINVLGSSKTKQAITTLGTLVEQWKAKTLPADVWLDVSEAVRAQGDKALIKQLDPIEKSLAKSDKLGLALLSLEGGDPVAGEIAFRTNTIASCMQCHVVGGTLATVGPNLTNVGTRLDRRKILTALVDPQAEIADGFGTINVTLKDGTILSGALASENANEIQLRPVGGVPQPISKTSITSQSKPISIMPPMAANLSRSELRDLVAYLASLK